MKDKYSRAKEITGDNFLKLLPFGNFVKGSLQNTRWGEVLSYTASSVRKSIYAAVI